MKTFFAVCLLALIVAAVQAQNNSSMATTAPAPQGNVTTMPVTASAATSEPATTAASNISLPAVFTILASFLFAQMF